MLRLAAVATICTALGFATALAFTGPEKDKAAPEMDPQTKAMMEAYMKAAEPGPNHQWLTRMAGSWTGKVTSWGMGPEPAQSEGLCENRMILGGRFCMGKVKGDMPGIGPMEGLMIVGFDNVIGKFQSFWIDSMGTGFMTGSGELSEDKKTLTWTLTANDPISKKATTYREVDTFTSDSQFKVEMFGPGPDGKEMRMMEIAYSRK